MLSAIFIDSCPYWSLLGRALKPVFLEYLVLSTHLITWIRISSETINNNMDKLVQAIRHQYGPRSPRKPTWSSHGKNCQRLLRICCIVSSSPYLSPKGHSQRVWILCQVFPILPKCRDSVVQLAMFFFLCKSNYLIPNDIIHSLHWRLYPNDLIRSTFDVGAAKPSVSCTKTTRNHQAGHPVRDSYNSQHWREWHYLICHRIPEIRDPPIHDNWQATSLHRSNRDDLINYGLATAKHCRLVLRLGGSEILSLLYVSSLS